MATIKTFNGVTICNKAMTAAEWETSNPVLALGETGKVTDDEYIKTGDGFTAWNDLPKMYFCTETEKSAIGAVGTTYCTDEEITAMFDGLEW